MNCCYVEVNGRHADKIYDELIAEGYAQKDVDYYLFCSSQHRPKEEERLKTLHVTASTGEQIELCQKCHEVKEEIAAFFTVPLSPKPNVENAQPEMIEVPFRPMSYCQCARMEAQPTSLSGLALGVMVHYVSGAGKHEPSVVIEIIDAAAGHVKLRNLANLTLDTCVYSEVPLWDSWHWPEKEGK